MGGGSQWQLLAVPKAANICSLAMLVVALIDFSYWRGGSQEVMSDEWAPSLPEKSPPLH